MTEEEHGHDEDLPEERTPHRETAPQQDYSTRQVAIGFVVLAVGLVLTFGLAVGLTL